MRVRWVALGLAALVTATAVPADALQAGNVVSIPPEQSSWRERAALAMDHSSLAPALRANGYAYAGSDEIYAAEIVPGVGQPAFVMFDAVEGAFSQRFWPASAVKLVAAVAALEFAGTLGYAGDARVSGSWVGERTIRSIYEPAIVRSDNYAYDLLVRIAGVDFLNRDFLVRHGLDSMTIGSDLSGLSVLRSPSFTLVRWMTADELPRQFRDGFEPVEIRRTVPSRTASWYYRSNNTDLFDLAETVRRVVLHDEIPDEHRFALSSEDVGYLTEALCSSEPAHYAWGARQVLGDGVAVCGKSGWWDRLPEEEENGREPAGEEEPEQPPPPLCIDVAVVSDPDTGRRILLAATGGCGAGGLRALAAPALEALAGLRGPPLQEDAGVPVGVSLEAVEGMLEVTVETDAGWALVWVDDAGPFVVAGRGGTARGLLPMPDEGRHLLIVEAISYGVKVGYRAADFEVGGT